MRIFRPLAYLAFLLLPALVRAHPLDEANLYHFFSCKLTPTHLTIDYKVLVGGLVVFKTWNEIDTNRDHLVSGTEKSLFFGRIATYLTATLDGKPVSLNLTRSSIPTYDDFVTGNVPYLQFNLIAEWKPLSHGSHTLVLRNDGYPAYSNIYPKSTLEAPAKLDAKADTAEKQKGFTLTFTIPGTGNTLTPQTATTPQPSPPTPSAKTLQDQRRTSSGNRLMKYVLGGRMSLPALIGALLIAVMLGAGHALTPGHGKTLVGAYLVGERGTVKDAVFLGLVVTFAHTATVYLFGLVILGLVHFVSEKQLGFWLGVGSGALVIATGFWLLVRGLLRWYGVEVDHHHHDHEHPHDHDHDHPHDAGHRHHGQTHTHSHGTSRGSLLSLGIAGGAVPCPDAIAVLAAAINAGNVAFGLVLITAFSAGMAGVLIAIGILMVTAKARMARFTGEGKFLKALPIASAAVVMVLGIVLVGQALIQAKILILP
jgi:nickel/cobalt exporter